MLYNQPFGITDPNASYINGNPSTGTMGSIPPAASIEYDQREIVEVINYAYQHGYRDNTGALCNAPTNADLTQLRKAIWGFINSNRLALNLTYFVNNTGSDTNDGLTAATPFQTIQAAINASQQYDPSGFQVKIVVADGTYAPFSCGGGSLKGWGSVWIIGNITTPAACIIQSADVPCALFQGNSRNYLMGGFRIVNNGALPRYGCGILAANTAWVQVYNMDFGPCAMYHMWSSNSTFIMCGMIDGVPNVTYPFIRVSGSVPSGAHMRGSEGGSMSSRVPDLTITQAVNIAIWNTCDNMAHSIYVGDPYGSQPNFYNSITGKANVTGQRYQVTGNSVINAGGSNQTYFPGTIAGVFNTGGQYM